MNPILRIGTRGSALALAQANWLRGALQALLPDRQVELTTIRTSGDRFVDRPLRTIGGKGLFVKEIEEALLAGSIDCAIHSMKDVPAELAPGLVIAAIPPREDPRDVLITREGRELAALPAGARVGTSSLRRTALLRAMRPDLEIFELRGNVDTRLRKLDAGELDAILLAAAGLRRLGLQPDGARPFDVDSFLPAIGQGALAIETRGDEMAAAIAALNHLPTAVAVTAERAFLATVGGSCHTPIAAYATLSEDEIQLKALIAHPDGSRLIYGSQSGSREQAGEIGGQLAGRLLAQGGDQIIAEVLGNGA